MDEWKKTRGGQIPAFGNWDNTDDMPITQYFECARQAGLVRYSSSSGECGCGCADLSHNYNYNYDYDYNYNYDYKYNYDINVGNNNNNVVASPDLYSTHHYVKPRVVPPSKQRKNREKRGGGAQGQVKEGGKKQGGGKVYDVRVTEKKPQYQYDAALSGARARAHAHAQPCRVSKAVDEDLYHIPPELLKRKRRLGFFSRCLVPPCAV